MDRTKWSIAAALLAGVFLAAPATGQTTTAIVGRPTAVLDGPTGDSHVLDQLPMGAMVEVVGRSGDWFLVNPPAAGDRTFSWQRGWIPVSVFGAPPSKAAGTGRFMVRAFGRAGGTLFTAHDSFDTILGRPLNSVYGGGGQVVLPNGIFFEASVDRFRHDGTLALGAGEQVFRLETPTRLTLTPVQLTGGYRIENTARVASYFGGGMGWYTFEEESPFAAGDNVISRRSNGYHVLGGAELKMLRWLWIGGEAQWATVPKALGETGVSAIFQEKDLGGATFAVKLIVGY